MACVFTCGGSTSPQSQPDYKIKTFVIQYEPSNKVPFYNPGPVPPNATVVFEVEVYSVSRGPRSVEAFGEVDVNKDQSLTKEEVRTVSALTHDWLLMAREQRLLVFPDQSPPEDGV